MKNGLRLADWPTATDRFAMRRRRITAQYVRSMCTVAMHVHHTPLWPQMRSSVRACNAVIVRDCTGPPAHMKRNCAQRRPHLPCMISAIDGIPRRPAGKHSGQQTLTQARSPHRLEDDQVHVAMVHVPFQLDQDEDRTAVRARRTGAIYKRVQVLKRTWRTLGPRGAP